MESTDIGVLLLSIAAGFVLLYVVIRLAVTHALMASDERRNDQPKL